MTTTQGGNGEARRILNHRRRLLQNSTSHVVPIQSHPLLTGDDQGRRLVPLAAFFALESDNLLLAAIGAWLAWSHLEIARLGAIDDDELLLAEVHERLQDCDVQFGLQLYDPRTPLQAATELSYLMGALQLQQTQVVSPQQQFPQDSPLPPVAVIADGSSAPLLSLTSAFGIPLISPFTFKKVDNNPLLLDDQHLLVASPAEKASGKGEILALLRYFADLEVQQIACLYPEEHEAAAIELIQNALEFGVTVEQFSYDDGVDLDEAMQQLADSDRRYVVAMMTTDWKRVVEAALEQGILGAPGFVWMWTHANEIELDPTSESHLARALMQGSGFVQPARNHVMEQAFVDVLREFRDSEVLQSQFRHEILLSSGGNLQQQPANTTALMASISSSDAAASAYDAVMALAIASCESKEEFFTGSQLYQQLLRTEFEGVAGHFVAFDKAKRFDTAYTVSNLRVASETPNGRVRLEPLAVAATVYPNATIEHVRTFVYAGSDHNSTDPPPDVPPLTVEMNLVPPGISVFGLLLAVLVMLFAVAGFVWTVFHRRKSPSLSHLLLLCQLSIGAIILATSIFPMSLQEPNGANGRVPQWLDAACVISPWLLVTGWTTGVSALYTKARLLNFHFDAGVVRERKKQRPRDLLFVPLVLLMTANVLILTVWSTVSPLHWQRMAVAQDGFGRTTESYGTCQSSPASSSIGSVVALVGVNLLGVVLAFWQSYKARRFGPGGSEALALSIACAILLEASILGIPILLLVSESPTATFLTRSVLVCLSCFAILLPVFVPKPDFDTALMYDYSKQAGFGQSSFESSEDHDHPSGSEAVSGLSSSSLSSTSGNSDNFRNEEETERSEEPLPSATRHSSPARMQQTKYRVSSSTGLPRRLIEELQDDSPTYFL